MSDDTRLPDDKVHTPTPNNQAKLDLLLDLTTDIFWEARSVSGAGRSLLNQGIPKLGPDWAPVPNVHTTLEQEISALPQNFANAVAAANAAKAAADAATAAVKQLQSSLPPMINSAVSAALANKSVPAATVDTAAVAAAVVDELAARMKGTPTA